MLNENPKQSGTARASAALDATAGGDLSLPGQVSAGFRNNSASPPDPNLGLRSIEAVVMSLSCVRPQAIPGLRYHSTLTMAWKGRRGAARPGQRSRPLSASGADHVWYHIINRSEHVVLHGLWFLLSYQAGLRPCEIADLRLADLFTSAGEVRSHIFVRGHTIKRGCGARLVPMHPQLAEVLRLFKLKFPSADRVAVLNLSDGNLSPTTASAILQWFNRLYHATGLIEMTNMSGRHAFIERLVEQARMNGVSIVQVKRVVGHLGIATTASYLKPQNTRGAIVNLGAGTLES